jgi:hypothetical protein
VGLHAEDEKSYTVTGAKKGHIRYFQVKYLLTFKEGYQIVPSQVQSGFQGIEVKYSLTFNGNVLYALSQVQSDF